MPNDLLELPETAVAEEPPTAPETEPTPAPEWRLPHNPLTVEADTTGAMTARLSLRAATGGGALVHAEKTRSSEVIAERLRQRVAASEPAIRLARLHHQADELRQQAESLRAKVAKEQDRRAALCNELPDAVAPKLTKIDANLAKLNDELANLVAQDAALQPLIDSTRVALLAEAERLNREAKQERTAEVGSECNKALQALAAIVGDKLSDVVRLHGVLQQAHWIGPTRAAAERIALDEVARLAATSAAVAAKK